MSDRRFPWMRSAATAVVALAEWMQLAWQHFHGGVLGHHFLNRADMPVISNGWGGLLLPLVTWVLLGRVQRRIASQDDVSKAYALVGFGSALLFGVLLSVFFTLGNDLVPGAMFESLFLVALVAPIYRAEYLLGFVLGMAFTFGGVLPSIVGSVMGIITLVIHRYVRPMLWRIGSMIAGMAKKRGKT
ncbi:hypothetical protein [Dyella choica]|uniref:Uncharacterized protein n=1 Tax=Dyella choica TaxID=1927959 RepID=A0A432M5Y4_9GAMM|nr:hypothetical protein [Dyella choica]RUL75929.1 hypothetical protein EKH80_09385 [Dyella choica]